MSTPASFMSTSGKGTNIPASSPRPWVYPIKVMIPRVPEMVGDPVMIIMAVMGMVTHTIKVVENVVTGEEEPGPIEWVRNPAVEVGIIPWRRIIGDHRRAFLIIVIINYRRLNVFRTRGWLAFPVLPGGGHNGQTKLRSDTLECL